jgi:molecular chaperone Hsp33
MAEEQQIDIEKTKKELQLRDRVVKALSKDGKFRIAVIKNTTAVKEAQRRHQLDYLPAFMLARSMSAASTYAAFLKGEERVIIEVNGDGPVSKVYAEAIHVGEVRGFVQFNKGSEEMPINELSDVLGHGHLKLSRILKNHSEPLTGIVPITNGDISSEMIVYYTKSEQIPTYVLLPIKFDEETGLITQSGGVIAQVMPGYEQKDLAKLVAIFDNLPDILEMFENEMNPKQVMEEILPFEYDLIGSTQVDFFCRCSKDNFMDKMVTLGVDELKAIKSDGHRDLICQYCNEKYTLEDSDVDKIIELAQAKLN